MFDRNDASHTTWDTSLICFCCRSVSDFILILSGSERLFGNFNFLGTHLNVNRELIIITTLRSQEWITTRMYCMPSSGLTCSFTCVWECAWMVWVCAWCNCSSYGVCLCVSARERVRVSVWWYVCEWVCVWVCTVCDFIIFSRLYVLVCCSYGVKITLIIRALRHDLVFGHFRQRYLSHAYFTLWN